MAKIQTRRSVSLSVEIYNAIKRHGASDTVSMSMYVTGLIREDFAKRKLILPTTIHITPQERYRIDSNGIVLTAPADRVVPTRKPDPVDERVPVDMSLVKSLPAHRLRDPVVPKLGRKDKTCSWCGDRFRLDETPAELVKKAGKKKFEPVHEGCTEDALGFGWLRKPVEPTPETPNAPARED